MHNTDPRLKSLAAPLLAVLLTGCSFAPFGQRAIAPQAAPGETRLIYNPISGASYQLAMTDLRAARHFPRVRLAATAPELSRPYPVRETQIDAPPKMALIPPIERVAIPDAPAPVARVAIAAPSMAAVEAPVPAPVEAPVRVAIAAPAAVEAPGRLQLEREFASISRMVPFAINRAELGPQGRRAVAELVPIAREAREVYVRGRTDASGGSKINQSLASRRAETVAAALASGGVARDKIATSQCIDCYVASNATYEGRQLNRRVDVEMALPKARIAELPEPVHALETPPLIMARSLAYPPTAVRR